MHDTPRIYNLGVFFLLRLLPSVKFAEDKVLIFVILREKC